MDIYMFPECSPYVYLKCIMGYIVIGYLQATCPHACHMVYVESSSDPLSLSEDREVYVDVQINKTQATGNIKPQQSENRLCNVLGSWY